MRLLSFALLSFFVAGCALEFPEASFDASVRTESEGIVNGTREPQNTFLSESQILSIVFLADSDGDEFCTGTLIAPRVVLSAEHCIDEASASSLFIGFGMMPAERQALLPVSAIYPHPSIDFTIIILGADATEVLPGITPIAMNRVPVDETWFGRKVDASGYGDTYDNSTTGRFFASVDVVDVNSEQVVVDGLGIQGICYGDSGGPILWQPDADTPPVLVGTEQYGDATCVDIDHLTRVDVVADWVDEMLSGGLPPPLTACEEYVEPFCDGAVLRGCDGAYDRTQDCSEDGCGFMGPQAGYACLPAVCNGIDYFGECDGDLLRYCKGERLRERDCAARGQSCIFEGEDVGYNCGDCLRCGGSECIDMMTDTLHCGGCDINCALPNSNVSCNNSRCQFDGCIEGFANQDGDLTNGCETNTASVDEGSDAGDGSSGGTKSGSSDGGCQQAPIGSLFALLAVLARRRQNQS